MILFSLHFTSTLYPKLIIIEIAVPSYPCSHLPKGIYLILIIELHEIDQPSKVQKGHAHSFQKQQFQLKILPIHQITKILHSQET